MAGLARRDSGHGVDKPARRARIAGPGGADQRAGLARRGPRACGPQPREAAARLWRPEPPAALPGQRVDHRALLWIAPETSIVNAAALGLKVWPLPPHFADFPLCVTSDPSTGKLVLIPCWELFRFYYAQMPAVARLVLEFPRW